MAKESDPSMIGISTEARVWSRDGEEVGTVKDVAPEHFKVDASGKRDFWLSKRIVASADAESVHLEYTEEQLEPFKLESPAAAAESPVTDAQTDAFANAEEQRRRRENMRAGAAFDNGDGQRDRDERAG